MGGFVKVVFQPTGQTVFVPEGETVLAAALEAGLELHIPCGGHGTCGSCRIIFARPGSAPTASAEEAAALTAAEIRAGMRLACQARIVADAVVDVPATTMRKDTKFLLHGIMREVALEPAVEKLRLQVPAASLEDQRSDLDRLMAALRDEVAEAKVEPEAACALPKALRARDFSVTAVVEGGTLIAVEPGDTTDALYAAGFDIGTTTVVGMLLDLSTGRELAVAARTNPQVSYGDDVVSRISFAGTDGGLARLQGAIVECINDILAELCRTAGVPRDAVYEAVFCGNTAMNHFFLRVDPEFIAQAPYVAGIRGAVKTAARCLNVTINPAGRVVTLPNVAGFVGGDTVAMMLAADFLHSDKVRLAVDIGTNGEIVLGNKDRLVCASAAAGPAFEGARIRHGMRAASGAIESVRIVDGKLHYEAINGGAAVGLCGTGLIDCVAALLEAGIVDMTGRLTEPEEAKVFPADLARRVAANDAGPHFVVAYEAEGAARDVYLTQRDIRQLQLAKGAIAAAMTILMREFGVEPEGIEEVLLAGAFGNYIKKESALRIGLIPAVPLEKVKQIGNAAGTGSKLVALDRNLLAEAEELSLKARYLELAGRADFQQIFSEAMLF